MHILLYAGRQLTHNIAQFFLCCIMSCILLVTTLSYISSPQYKCLKLVCGPQIHCYIIYVHVCLLIYVFGCKISQVSLLSHLTWKQKNPKILKLMQIPEFLQMTLGLVLDHNVQKLDYRPAKIAVRKSFSYERPPSCLLLLKMLEPDVNVHDGNTALIMDCLHKTLYHIVVIKMDYLWCSSVNSLTSIQTV